MLKSEGFDGRDVKNVSDSSQTRVLTIARRTKSEKKREHERAEWDIRGYLIVRSRTAIEEM